MLLLKMPQKISLEITENVVKFQRKSDVTGGGAFDINLGDDIFLKILIFIVWKTNLRLKPIFTF